MNKTKTRSAISYGACILLVGGLITFAHARQASAAADTPVTVTVTATAKGNNAPPMLAQNEVVVRQQDQVRQIVSWTPVQQAQTGLEVVVMVDDALSTRTASQLDDLRNFVTSLPPNARVAVVYAQNGGAHFRQQFTTDHQLAAQAFRIPSAIPGSAEGIYDSISDLLKHWTPAPQSRHVLVIVSSGIDLSEGYADTNPALNTLLDHSVVVAQKAGIVVYTIYAPDPGRSLRGTWVNLNGQGSLGELSSATGGEEFDNEFGNPVSFQPYLQSIQQQLGQQYLLTFMAQPNSSGKAGISTLRVTSEQSGVQLHAPSKVFVPAS